MQFRLSFDDNISADLIRKIKARANGGSLNKALQIMVIEWFALNMAETPPSLRQEAAVIGRNQPDKEDDLATALDDLAAAWD